MQANLRGTRSVMPLALGLTILFGVAALVGLARPSQAAAAVTIGSDLSSDPFMSIAEGQCPCTVFQRTHPSAQTSPIDGVVVRYRIRKSSEGIVWGDVKLRILRSTDGGNTFQGVGTSPAASTDTSTEIVELPAQLPIKAGDQIGLDAAALYQVAEVPGATVTHFDPPLADSALPASPNGGSGRSELPFNADIEPDCDGDGFGDETQDGDISSCAPPPPPPPPPTPALSVADAQVTEGNTGASALFDVTLSAPHVVRVTASYTTADGTARAPADYAVTAGTVAFEPGEVTKTIAVPVTGDRLDEANETFSLTLFGATSATISRASATGTILDDDPPPKLKIGNRALQEGNRGTKKALFKVTLSAKSAKAITVTYSTANGKAKTPGDYRKRTGKLTFAPGQTAKTIAVPVVGERRREPNETFFVNLKKAVNAGFADKQGKGTIRNDD